MAYMTPDERKEGPKQSEPETSNEDTTALNIILMDALLQYLNEKDIIKMDEFADFVRAYKSEDKE